MGAGPVAFLSYSHDDDKSHNGNITRLREQLATHVEELTGDKFEIFQDRDSLAWGDSWRDRLVDSIDAVTFFLPILSPKFFKSDFCRKEVEQFLAREKTQGRRDLILPIVFVPIAHVKGDELLRALLERQHEDVTELRLKAWTDYAWIERVAKMAERIAARLNTQPDSLQSPLQSSLQSSLQSPLQSSEEDSQPSAPAKTVPQAPPASSMPAQARPTPAISFPAVRIDPHVHVVDAADPARASIAAAIAAAGPGDRIRIRPGVYRESLLLDRPVDLEGEGNATEIILLGTLTPAIFSRTTLGRVANLTVQQISGNGSCGLLIAGGQLVVEGCELTSADHACVVVTQGAVPHMRNNRIHDSRGLGVGVYFNMQAQGLFENNDVFDCTGYGVVIEQAANPTLKSNQLHAVGRAGAMINLGGLGLLEDNDIYSCGEKGILIMNESRPVIRNNRIHHANLGGIGVGNRSLGTIEGNQITQNGMAGIEIVVGSTPTVRGNRVSGNGGVGVAIYQMAGGLVVGNDLRGNQQGGWFVSPESMPMVQAANNLA